MIFVPQMYTITASHEQTRLPVVIHLVQSMRARLDMHSFSVVECADSSN
jgi:hypothetical protein